MEIYVELQVSNKIQTSYFTTNYCFTASRFSVLLAILLLTLQCVRRFYDTHCVSVFAKNSRMDLSHYLIGLIHYAGAVLAILCEAPLFAKGCNVVLILYVKP